MTATQGAVTGVDESSVSGPLTDAERDAATPTLRCEETKLQAALRLGACSPPYRRIGCLSQRPMDADNGPASLSAVGGKGDFHVQLAYGEGGSRVVARCSDARRVYASNVGAYI